MAFVTIEDLYGTSEVIVFESSYQKVANCLIEENIVLVTGRLSIREDSNISIIAFDITDLKKQEKVTLQLDITGIDEETKKKLRGAIRFFTGEKNNLPIEIKDGEQIMKSGAIFSNKDTIKQFKEILGEERVKI
jgi:DNA polymerase-3 subunit alpha